MQEPRCPHCQTAILKVRPVQMTSDEDRLQRRGAAVTVEGFACMQCNTLLPLVPVANPLAKASAA